jgi:hypothetical protein
MTAIDPATRLVLGVFALSCVLSYAWWVKLRLIRYRADLCDMRDELFEHAGRLNAYDDEAYMSARETINALIAMAGTISIPTLAMLVIRTDTRPIPKSANEELQAAISVALCGASERCIRFALTESLLGIVLVPIALGANVAKKYREAVIKKAAPFIASRMNSDLSGALTSAQ